METVDITPTDEGFASIAKLFIDSILAGSRKAAVTNNAIQLDSLLEIVGYLAVKNPAQFVALRAYVARRGAA